MAAPADLIKSLVLWLDVRAGVAPVGGVNRLWAHVAVEGDPPAYAETYAVLRPFGGAASRQFPGRDRLVQCFVTGKTAASAMAMAEQLYAGLLDDESIPVVEVPIDGYVISGITDLHPPVPLGQDGKTRFQVSFNFRVLYRAA